MRSLMSFSLQLSVVVRLPARQLRWPAVSEATKLFEAYGSNEGCAKTNGAP